MLFLKYEMLIEGGWVCIDWSRQSKAPKLFIWCNKRFLGSGGLIDYPYRLGNYDMAKICLESCAADYSPIHGRRIVSVTDERLWDTPARPITPTSSDTE